jgi:hypothetical protein
MTWVAVAVAGAGVVGSVISSQGAKKAANTAAQGGDAAAQEAARQFDIIQGNNQGRINIGNQAINALGSMYGYSPTQGSPYQAGPTAGATPYTPQQMAPGGALNSGIGALANPYTLTSKLGDARYVLDPAGKLFGNLFGGGHGDENRNLKAFGAESGVMQLPNGMLMLPDGSTFNENQLKDVAGTWYGAMHAPDGNQQDWQNRYSTLLGGLQKTPVGQPQSAAPGGPAANTGANPLTAPDYSAFFKSPDYQFRKDQGMQGIGNSFSASGGAKSGNALKALADFNSNLAAGEFGNYFNRQLALAGQGQASTNTSAQAGIATGGIVGNALQNSADTRASGVAGGYNAIGAGISGLGQGLGYYLQQRQNPYGNYAPQANNWGYGRVAPGSYS